MRNIKLGNGRIVYGDKAIEAVSSIKSSINRALIIMSGNIMIETGGYQILENELVKNGFEIKVFTEVEPEPSFESILKGKDIALDFKPDWIIGFGGGSAMDAAKAIWVCYENPEVLELKEIAAPNTFNKLREKAKLCCIATSAGTGSESTRASMIKDLKTNTKYSIRCLDGRLVPDLAILDPQFTKTMPKDLTAASGMDALTHAIETYVAKNGNPFSDALAYKGFHLGIQSLERAYTENDEEARIGMLVASNLAGIAFSNAGLGINHSIAHSIGTLFNIPHGLANAVVLPYVIQFNSQNKDIKKKYDELAKICGEESLLEVILGLRETLKVPHSMKELINEEVFNPKIHELTQKALNDVCTPTSPITPTKEEMQSLISNVYQGGYF